MKKLLSVIAWTLALNFLAAVGGIVYLFKSGQLDHEKVTTIKELVFKPSTQPAESKPDVRDPTTQPALKLEHLLSKVAGRPASEQVEFMQRTFDAQMSMLDRRFREIQELRGTVELAQKKLVEDRAKLAAEQQKLATAQDQQIKLQSDKGFQDTLALYTSMPSKQAKTVFMTMTDDTMIQYLRAMEPRAATKIVKEFKTPEETERISKVMEKMRQAQAALKE